MAKSQCECLSWTDFPISVQRGFFLFCSDILYYKSELLNQAHHTIIGIFLPQLFHLQSLHEVFFDISCFFILILCSVVFKILFSSSIKTLWFLIWFLVPTSTLKLPKGGTPGLEINFFFKPQQIHSLHVRLLIQQKGSVLRKIM